MAVAANPRAGTNGRGKRNGSGPRSIVHYSDSSLLGFYFHEVSPQLDRMAVWPGLVPKGERLEDAPCSKCGRADTFTYSHSQYLFCAHRNSCGSRESILERLSGVSMPSGDQLVEAVREAARIAGVAFQESGATEEERQKAREDAQSWARRREALERAAKWAQDELWGTSEKAAEALVYLHGRGFTDEGIRDLEIGLFTATELLYRSAGFTVGALGVAADRAYLNGRNLEGYIVFPWRDEHGNLLTLYGRWPNAADGPARVKHAGRWKSEDGNKPVPKTYALPGADSKADPLYFDRVRAARSREVVLVEGVIDAALAHQFGDTRVCAYVAGTPAGKQIEAIERYNPDCVTLCPDPDDGGDHGLQSAIRRFQEVGVRTYVAPRLPDGKDPDEFILTAEIGIEGWRAHIEAAKSAAVYMAELILASVPEEAGTKAKEAALRKLIDLCAKLSGDGAELDRAAIVELAAVRLEIPRAQIKAELGKHSKAQRGEAKKEAAKAAEPAPERKPPAGDDWAAGLMWTYTKTGAYLTKNLGNAVSILAHHPAWDGVLAFDEFGQKTVALKAPPSHGHALAPKEYPHRWVDHDDALAAVWLQRLDPVLDVEARTAARAVSVVAQLRRVHPVREYLDSLRWDGSARLDQWLVIYAGGESITGGPGYLAEVGSKWMIAAVARIYRPGCKVDTVLVLEGIQGAKKSTAFRILGHPWFTDELSDVGSKDAAMQLQGAWIIELAELDALSRAESAKIKSFFTRTVERYVPKWGLHPTEVPRQCVFAGTVNPDTYLKDETGNRRFWPVRCGATIDTEGLQRDRDQLWAEAVHRFRAGEAWHLGQIIEVEARSEQDARFQGDAWENLVEGYVVDRDRVSVHQVLAGAIGLAKSDWGQTEQNRVARCLRRIGWERKRVRLRTDELAALGLASGSGLAWIYVPPPREPGEDG